MGLVKKRTRRHGLKLMLKDALAAGLEIVRIEEEVDGKITITTGKPDEQVNIGQTTNGAYETPEDLRKLI